MTGANLNTTVMNQTSLERLLDWMVTNGHQEYAPFAEAISKLSDLDRINLDAYHRIFTGIRKMGDLGAIEILCQLALFLGIRGDKRFIDLRIISHE